MKRKKRNTLIVVVFILVVVFGMMLYFYRSLLQNKPVNSSNENVQVTNVMRQNIKKQITDSGEISSSLQERLEPKKNRLKEIYVEENQIVKKGEKLLKYTNGTYWIAPYDLVVMEVRLGKIGEICDPNSQYIEVADMTNLIVTLEIDESDKKDITVGQEVQIKANAFENKTYTGKVKKIDAIGQYKTTGSSFNVTIELENDGMLNVGMSAFCQIIIAEAKDVLAVPIEAITTLGEDKFVTIVKEDGTTQEVKVEIGISNDYYVEIKSGLEFGQKIQYRQISKNNNSATGSIQIDSSEFMGY